MTTTPPSGSLPATGDPASSAAAPSATATAPAGPASGAPAGPPLVDLGGRSPWSILPALCLGFFMIMVDTTIVNIAVPTLVDT